MKKNPPRTNTLANNGASAALRQRWQALDARERRGISLAAAVVLLALLWWLGLAPVFKNLAQRTR